LKPPTCAVPWRGANISAGLNTGEVHVWLLRLDLPPRNLAELRHILNDQERQRAARFHFEGDSHRFIAAHGQLRILLGRYLAREPGTVAFQESRSGKPCLGGDPGRLRFNLSHSGERALLAVALGREIGVDIERIDREVCLHEIAQRFFSPAEQCSLLACPKEEQREAFFRCWTRKEAFVKAHGEGLSFGLDQFSVSLNPAAALLLEIGGDTDEAARWQLHHLEPAPGYVGAVAFPRVINSGTVTPFPIFLGKMGKGVTVPELILGDDRRLPGAQA
jgi:4'-phosphopantetheinyl transferase